MIVTQDARATFIVPDRLTVGQERKYEKIVIEMLEKFKDQKSIPKIDTDFIIFVSAIQSGLVTDLKTEGVATNDDEADVYVVEAIAGYISQWMDEKRRVPKVSGWRWIVSLLVKILPRPISSRTSTV